jgi:ABC-2 type transport system permease protein
MNLPLLFRDELKGFYKSKVMIALWVGLPVIAILFRLVSFSTTGEDVPFTAVSSLVVASIGGTLAAVMLSVFIINEKNRHVYELFLIRPIKRWEIILAKFLAIYLCVAIASLIAVATGIAVDYATAGVPSTALLSSAGESLVISLSSIAISCSIGVLIGIASPSVLVGAILVIYGGNQISAIISLMPIYINIPYIYAVTAAIATSVTIAMLAVSILIFNRKQF